MDETSTDASGLLHAVARGEPEAIDRWFRAEHPQVYRLCAGFLADAAEAEDIAQDAMLKLLDTLPRWDRRRPWRSWRNTLVLNLCRDRLRRAREPRRRGERGRAAVPAVGAALARGGRAGRGGAHAAAGRARALSPREREAFVLHDLEGADAAETALALGIGESSVRSLLSLARRRLRTLLGPHLAPSGGADA
jgi:RNA polymerase sigma-70 factor (ECF subfamily)